MKFTIILKQQDADGLGGDLLEAMGMNRSEHAPTVFTRLTPAHNIEKLGTGDSSWSLPEAHTQMYVEALADYGIRPMRVFQKHDAAAGLTPLHASCWADADAEDELVSNPNKPVSPIEDALSQVESAVDSISTAVSARNGHFKPSRHSAPYLDAVAMLASNNYGPWDSTDKAESHVRKAIKDYANEKRKSVIDAFDKNDVKYIVESVMYSDDPDPYGMNPPDPKVGKTLLQALKKMLGPDYKSYAGVRKDAEKEFGDGGWVAYIEGHPRHDVDTLWQPLTQALKRAGYRNALVEPYDNARLGVSLS